MDEEKSLWPGRIGLLLALIVATGLGLWLLPDAIRQHASELELGDYTGIATMLGERLAVIIAVVFLVLYIIFLRGWGLERSIIYLAVIVFVAVDADAAIIYATRVFDHERSFQFGQAVADVKTIVQNFDNPNYAEETLQARAANDARIIASIGTDEAARINGLRASYQSERSALILDGTLKPKALETARGIRTARARIAAARALVKKYRDAEQKVFAGTWSAVVHARVDDSVRAQMMAAFDRSLKQRSALSQKLWDCEDQSFVETDLLVQDLGKADWRAQGDVFLFTSQRDLNAFTAHVANLHKILLTERALEVESGDTIVMTVQNGLPGTD